MLHKYFGRNVRNMNEMNHAEFIFFFFFMPYFCIRFKNKEIIDIK